MRVLLLVNEYPPQKIRGTAMATAALAKSLAERGHDVQVIVTYRDEAAAGAYDGKVLVHRLFIVPVRFTRTVQRLLQIIRLAYQLRPDVVQGQAASCGLFAVIVGRLLKIPCITYVQGGDFNESGELRRLLEVAPAIRYADKCIATTEALAQAIQSYVRRSIDVVPHGYQPETISEAVVQLTRRWARAGTPCILFVGFLDPDKGVAHLVSAVAQLAGDWPDLTLLIVGQGPLRNELEQQAAQLGMAAKVQFLGVLPHDQVLALMRQADLFVLPSVSAEPFGIVLIEALNEGCPVVATEVCGSAALVDQGRNGYVVRGDSAEALAGAMRKILNNPTFKQDMQASALDRVRKLRWDHLVRRFEAFYHQVLERPLRVCIIVNEYPPGRIAGTAMSTQALARFLVRKGCRVFVIVTERHPNEPALAEEDGIVIRRLRTGVIPVFRWCRRVLRIRRLVGAIAPDVIHGQSISCGFYADAAARGRSIPVLACIQGYDLWESSGFQRRTEVRWALRGADRVTAVSPVLAQMGAAIAGLPRIEVLPHGFYPEPGLPERALLRERFKADSAHPVLLSAARLLPIKGIDVLLRALAEVPRAVLWIVGDGPERPRLEALTSQLHLDARVQFFGNLSHRDLAERMKAADLFVLASRAEPFGIVLPEAMEAGLPIVATDVGGIPSIVGRDNGVLVPPDDAGRLAQAILGLLEDPARRLAMSQANEIKAKAYRWESLGEAYLSAYRELVAAGGAR